MTQPTRPAGTLPHQAALALLLLWMIAFAPERWQRALGQVMAFLATVQMVAVPFLWRAWRAQRTTNPDRRR